MHKLNDQKQAIKHGDAVFTLESYYVANSATLIPKPKFYADALRGPFPQL